MESLDLEDGRGAVVRSPPRALRLALRLAMALMMPYLLIVGSARLVTSETFLYLEYSRSGFPVDGYGFTTEHRMKFGVFCIRYMTNSESIGYLQELTLPRELCKRSKQDLDTCPMFEEKELHHMEDVKRVSSGLFTALWLLLLLFVAFAAHLRDAELIRNGLVMGSILTYVLMLSTLLCASFAWRWAFAKFHKIFFKDGSWDFANNSTLLRLYPKRFWMDATSCVGVLALLGATAVLLAARRLRKAKDAD